MPDTMPDTQQDNRITANQFEAARKIAIAAMRRQHSIAYLKNLHILMPDHFSFEDYVGEVEIDQAIDILNAIDADLFIKPETDPDVGSVGWLNAALSTRKSDDTY